MRLLSGGSPPRPTPGLGAKTGLTLVEVIIAMVITATVTVGALGTLLTTRQMTDFARKQMLVDTAMQGLAEQLKSKTAIQLLPIAKAGDPPPACLANMTAMTTYLAAGNPPISISVAMGNDPANPLTKLILSPDNQYIDPTKIPPGAVPADIHHKGFGDIDGDGIDDVGINLLKLDLRGTTGLNQSTSRAGDDLNVYIMVWVKDYSPVSAPLAVESRAFIINYTWIYKEGKVIHKIVDTVKAIRTAF